MLTFFGGIVVLHLIVVGLFFGIYVIVLEVFLCGM